MKKASAASYKMADALRAVLIFHSANPWDAEKQARWLHITGTREATTKVLCDHIRAALEAYGYR